MEILDNARFDEAKESAVNDLFTTIKNGATAASLHVRNRYPGVFDRSTLPTMDLLTAMAKRMVAASCCTFLQRVDRDNARSKERWRPYQRWLGLLRSNDSILTFNYDRVIELLKPKVGGSFWRVQVFSADNTWDARDDEEEARAAELPTLYKLHGSVDWSYDAGQVLRRSEWEPAAMLKSDCNLAIATPGDSKMQMANGVFKRLWDQAASALREADDVFIIGFRRPTHFPGTSY